MRRARSRWTAEERQIAMEQRLRAQTIPSKKYDGPDKEEWDYEEEERQTKNPSSS
jgi:hypothetical protein